MFVGFSRALHRAGGFRIGAGFRVSRRNAWFGFLVLTCIYMAQMMWYVMLLTGWVLYGMAYASYAFYCWCFNAAKSLYAWMRRRSEGA